MAKYYTREKWGLGKLFVFFGLEFAGFDFFESCEDPLVKIDIFDSGDAENGHDEIAELLLVGLIFLSGDVEGLPAMLSEVGTSNFSDFFSQ